MERENVRNLEVIERGSVASGADNVPVLVRSNSGEFLKCINRFDPGVNIGKGGVAIDLVEKDTDVDVIYDSRERRLSVIGRPDEIGRNVDHIIYCLAEVERNRQGRFTMHAAAVSNGSESILIMGNKGAGKTSLAMEMSTKMGWKLYGNDIIVCGDDAYGGLTVFGGDGQFKTRQIAMKAFPQYAEICSFDPDFGIYDAKAVIDPASLNVQVETVPLPMKKIITVFLCGDEDYPLTLSTSPRLNLRLNMFEVSSRYIRAINTPIIGSGGDILGALPSLDTDELVRKRLGVVEKMIASDIVTVSSGKVSEIANYLANL